MNDTGTGDRSGTRQAAERAARIEEETAGRPPDRRISTELKIFTWKVLIAAGIGAVLFLCWQVANALLLVFTGVLFAILLQHMAQGVHRWTWLPQGWALGLVLVALAGLVVGGGFLMGQSLLGQFGQLSQQVNAAIGQLPPEIQDQITQQGSSASLLSRVQSVATGVMSFLGDAVVVLFTAIYLAASPGLYRRGVVLLVPPRGHTRAEEVMDVMGGSLWKWLIGQLASMAVVGLLTTGGLLLLGIPAAPALGLIAALMEFVPLIGPFIAAVPALLIAFAQSPNDALWVAGLYILIQQIEGNLVLPMMQKRVVDLPPVITLGAIAAGGLLFGILGMFLATPLAVVALVLINMLYIEDKLGEGRHFPKEG
ncbi:AI-2E family transporter [Azospirillum sp. SYSU D00513]|uniref:AI-2E family transporter n=1 Tax=Azospirillum sp. SYSU D00513 TaxID=2812561 RepID=UPI001A96E307|nr:AI-2E family transporter [Azospirillum sp. SYSU D00513]